MSEILKPNRIFHQPHSLIFKHPTDNNNSNNNSLSVSNDNLFEALTSKKNQKKENTKYTDKGCLATSSEKTQTNTNTYLTSTKIIRLNVSEQKSNSKVKERYKEYFGRNGGITLSGGEPLLQAEFAAEILKLCKERDINTCLDTSGSILNEKTEKLLDYTDYCLLDIKYTTDSQYRRYVGCGINKPLEFLERLNAKKIPTRIRQVIIDNLNDDTDNLRRLAEIVRKYPCTEKTELLAFRKLCASKYQKLGIDFPLAGTPETPQYKIKLLEEKLAEVLKEPQE